MPSLKDEFTKAMYDLDARAEHEANCPSPVFRRMIGDHDGVEAARRLIFQEPAGKGFTCLFLADPKTRRFMHLSVEAFVVENAKFYELVGCKAVAKARKRLAEVGYVPKENNPR